MNKIDLLKLILALKKQADAVKDGKFELEIRADGIRAGVGEDFLVIHYHDDPKKKAEEYIDAMNEASEGYYSWDAYFTPWDGMHTQSEMFPEGTPDDDESLEEYLNENIEGEFNWGDEKYWKVYGKLLDELKVHTAKYLEARQKEGVELHHVMMYSDGENDWFHEEDKLPQLTKVLLADWAQSYEIDLDINDTEISDKEVIEELEKVAKDNEAELKDSEAKAKEDDSSYWPYRISRLKEAAESIKQIQNEITNGKQK